MSRKEKKYHFIYKTIDARNENFYIGMHSTNDLNDGYIGSGTRLKKLIYKYGKSIFKLEILEFLPDRESLKKREEEIVNSDLLKEDKCMNQKVGGYGGFTIQISIMGGQKSKIAQKILRETNPDWVTKKHNKCSISQKKNYNEGKREKISFYDWKGKKHSDETKIKIGKANSIKQKGSLNSQFGTCWITNGNENKKIKNENFYLYQDIWYRGRSKVNKINLY